MLTGIIAIPRYSLAGPPEGACECTGEALGVVLARRAEHERLLVHLEPPVADDRLRVLAAQEDAAVGLGIDPELELEIEIGEAVLADEKARPGAPVCPRCADATSSATSARGGSRRRG